MLSNREWAKAQGIKVVPRNKVNTIRLPIDECRPDPSWLKLDTAMLKLDRPGDVVRRKRKRLKLTQAQLARNRGVTESFIKKVEQGRRPVPKLLMAWATQPV